MVGSVVDSSQRQLTALRVSDHLQGNRSQMTALLCELAEAESPSSQPETVAAVFELLARPLEQIGYTVKLLSDGVSGGQLLAYPAVRKRGPRQLLIGHADTVWPCGTLETMPVEVREGRLYGPGVYDMKAGLVQMVYACRALHELDLEPEVTPVVFVTSDEETGSQASIRWIERLARIADRAFVLEPALGPEGQLKTARKGVGRFAVRVTGQAAHAGLEPERGVSAILELSVVVQKLFALNGQFDGVTVNVGKIDGGLRPNVVAPEGSAVVDVRAPTLESAAAVEEAIRAIEPSSAGTRVIIEGGFDRPAMEKTAGVEALWKRAQEAAGMLGFALGDGTAGGGSDGNFTSQHTATLDGLGAVGQGAHAADECVVLASLAERAALLALLMLDPPLDLPRRRGPARWSAGDTVSRR